MIAHRVEHLADGVTLYLGDCRDVLPTLGKVDAVVTSPPYADQRKYGDNQSSNWLGVVQSIGDVKDFADTQILVNFGLVHINGAVLRYWDPFIEAMESRGWRLFSWYVWDQCNGMAGSFGGRLAPSFEFVFHFNRKPRVVNKTKRTMGGVIHGPNYRSKNDEQAEKSHKGRDVQPLKISDNVIRCTRETSPEFSEHPARFPVKLADELILPFTSVGDVVCDPFLGSGTVGVAAVKLGRKFIGIEIEPKYFDIACRRISDALARPDLFIAPPKPIEKQESLLP